MTGDDKHDIDINTGDLRDYCVMQNWYDSSKETAGERKTKNQDNSIVLPSGKDAIIAASSGIFLGLAEAGEVVEVELNDEKPTL